MAWWQSGYAEDCKSLDAGSIPTQASRVKAVLSAFFLIQFCLLYLQKRVKILNLAMCGKHHDRNSYSYRFSKS